MYQIIQFFTSYQHSFIIQYTTKQLSKATENIKNNQILQIHNGLIIVKISYLSTVCSTLRLLIVTNTDESRETKTDALSLLNLSDDQLPFKILD